MGSGSSLEVQDDQNQSGRQSVRQSFHNEFGDVADDDPDEPQMDNVNPQSSQESGKEARTKKMSVAMGQTTNVPTVMRAKNMFKLNIKSSTPAARKKNALLIKKQDNHALLREVFHRMNPDIAAASSHRVVGEVELAVKFRALDSKLLIKVSRVKHLANKGIGGNPDPYVKINLMMAGSRTPRESAKTKVVSSSTSASFNEIFVFGIPESDVVESTLHVEVWDRDVLSQDDFLGECRIILCDQDLVRGPMLWYQLLPQVDVDISGSVDISLDFSPPRQLVITVHEARALKSSNTLSNSADAYVRLSITGLPNKEETKVVENSLDPIWEERKEFSVAPEEFSRRVVIVSLMNKETFGQDKRLGDVHIPLSEFNPEEDSGDRRTYELKDLRNAAQTRSKWTEEGLVMEFKEALAAHALYGYPRAVFKKQHKGRMLLSVSSTKARSQAKMVLANGVPDE